MFKVCSRNTAFVRSGQCYTCSSRQREPTPWNVATPRRQRSCDPGPRGCYMLGLTLPIVCSPDFPVWPHARDPPVWPQKRLCASPTSLRVVPEVPSSSLHRSVLRYIVSGPVSCLTSVGATWANLRVSLLSICRPWVSLVFDY